MANVTRGAEETIRGTSQPVETGNSRRTTHTTRWLERVVWIPSATGWAAKGQGGYVLRCTLPNNVVHVHCN
jgi:hypothetical protein